MLPQLPFELGHFGTGVELSIGHIISTGIKMSGHFEVSQIRNVSGSGLWLPFATLQEKMSDIR